MTASRTPKKVEPRPSLAKRQVEMYRGLAGFGTLGLEITLSIGLMGLLGWWLDKRWQISPVLLLVGIGLGTVVAIKAIVRVMRQLKKVAEKEEREEGNPAPLYESAAEREQRRLDGERLPDPVVGETEEDDGSKRRSAAAD